MFAALLPRLRAPAVLRQHRVLRRRVRHRCFVRTLAYRAAASPSHPLPVGVVFDIDGVLLRGYHPLPGARESLLRLIEHGVPFIFLTNGGGEREARKAAKLSDVLALPVHPAQVVLSHTPLRPAVQRHAEQKILVLGCREVDDVARSYGALRVFTVPDLARDDPTRYPFLHWDHAPLPGSAAERAEPFGAVFILHDPNNWGAEIQVCLDVIRGGWPLGSGLAGQTVPVYASNPDIVFAGTYPVPRLAGGAFSVALRALYRATAPPGADPELTITQCGKPTQLTFDCAAATLAQWFVSPERHQLYRAAGLLGGESSSSESSRSGGTAPFPLAHPKDAFRTIFMVGDNPAADVRGANAAGAPWRSVLVRTGVFQGFGGNDARDPASAVVDGVTDAVALALDAARAHAK